MLEGVLIAESLQLGTELAGARLHITKIARVEVNNAAVEQPQQWTLLDFTAEEADAERLAEQLAACLAPTGGWYVNYNTTTQAFVIFAEKIFRYPRKQAEGRRQAQDYARSIGIPEPQLDWQD
ncbi:hypothetical protein [Streptomyces sp. 351MFTsu5.1]|uniref:hypothetical protein n=1 Tax=Streptomyces sp. 351MFTsu5.1 TaxID=1172180 RepID=UPI000375DCE3|nr:hypothetical protein [Streptomyces sp. 351MFTsu5.1]